MITLLYSLLDPAGVNIASNLIEKFKFKEVAHQQFKILGREDVHLIGVNERLTNLENLDEKFRADLFIFLSKHRSESELKSFTAHTPGNWGKAELGGEEKKLSFSCPSKLKVIAREMSKLAKEKIGWPFYIEVDHHGPFTNTSSIFVEIGSSENEWNNKIAGEVVAEAVMRGIASKERFEVAFCIGGGHYAPAFTKIILETDTAISHILPKYSIDEIDLETFKQGITNSVEPVKFILLDWKGMKKEQREKVIKLAEDLGLEYRRV